MGEGEGGSPTTKIVSVPIINIISIIFILIVIGHALEVLAFHPQNKCVLQVPQVPNIQELKLWDIMMSMMIMMVLVTKSFDLEHLRPEPCRRLDDCPTRLSLFFIFVFLC